MSKLTTATAISAITDTVQATDRDGIIMELHGLGYSLNMATNAYSAYAKANGLMATIVSHKAEALDRLSEVYGHQDLWTAEAVRDEVITLVDMFDIAESTARDYCKAYSEQIGVDHPTSDPRTAIFEWFKIEGDTANKDEFLAFAASLGRSRSNANEYWKGYELHLFLVA